MAADLFADLNIGLKVSGVDALVARFERGGKAAREAILRVVGESAARLHQRTVDLAPKRSGYMAEHVRTDFSRSGLSFETGWDASDFLGTIDEHGRERPFYPLYVEFGTRHMAAQPSLSIAYAEEEPLFKAELSEALRRALDGL
jgi:HK97 gp10 family phage protein